MSHSILMFVALILALVFELANGFHDTANAVATVIYTRSLKPMTAVAFSALFNFLGVWLGGIAVAMSIVHLLPAELLVSAGSQLGLAMVFSLLLTAIFWNIGTWFFAIPASSSHTLIGSILGVGVAHSIWSGHSFGYGVNWQKAGDVMLSLLVSPFLGFTLGYFFLKVLFRLARVTRYRVNLLLRIPSASDKPPFLIRTLLISTSAGVSLAHGSNDGQKGVGLVLLILVGLLPNQFTLRPDLNKNDGASLMQSATKLEQLVPLTERLAHSLLADLARVKTILSRSSDLDPTALTSNDRAELRRTIVKLSHDLPSVTEHLPPKSRKELLHQVSNLRSWTDFAPRWVIALVSLALSIGTLLGWKRMVVTVGEKIGKKHLSYAQGAVSESIALGMIGVSSVAGFPVSTTHVLSSAVAGTMMGQGTGLQFQTVKRIALAWVLTLPVTIFGSGALFLIFASWLTH